MSKNPINSIKFFKRCDGIRYLLINWIMEIGDLVRVTDNSYIKNIETGKSALLVQYDSLDPDDEYYTPTQSEVGAHFLVSSKPYLKTTFMNKVYEFVHITSSLTKSIYEVPTGSLRVYPPGTEHLYFESDLFPHPQLRD